MPKTTLSMSVGSTSRHTTPLIQATERSLQPKAKQTTLVVCANGHETAAEIADILLLQVLASKPELKAWPKGCARFGMAKRLPIQAKLWILVWLKGYGTLSSIRKENGATAFGFVGEFESLNETSCLIWKIRYEKRKK